MLKPMVTQIGTGTDLQGEDYTKAARRALSNALRRNSLTIAPALGLDREQMQVTIRIGVARPDRVDADAVAADLPYGRRSVEVVEGGMDIEKDDGTRFVLANCAVLVALEVGP